MPNFTPGKWQYNGGHVIWAEEDGNWVDVVALPARTGAPTEANARLIAAAPQMYEALRDLRLYIATDANLSTSAIMHNLLIKAEAVLAKVEGE